MRDFTLLFPVLSCIISSSLHVTFLFLFNSSMSTFMFLAKNKVLWSMWIYITIMKYDFCHVLSKVALKSTPLFQSMNQINYSIIFEFELLVNIFFLMILLYSLFLKRSPLYTMMYALSYMQTLKLLLNRKCWNCNHKWNTGWRNRIWDFKIFQLYMTNNS